MPALRSPQSRQTRQQEEGGCLVTQLPSPTELALTSEAVCLWGSASNVNRAGLCWPPPSYADSIALAMETRYAGALATTGTT